MSASFVVAILGAESTGKSTLAHDLQQALGGAPAVALVDEYLREFCEAQQRTPQRHEQHAIAAEQTRRIESAARRHPVVIADTTALMIAVYSDLVFGDCSLYERALREHARCDLSLLTAIDLPWVADGLQRDGAHVRDAVDERLRAALQRHGLGYSVVGGQGVARSAAALAALQAARRAAPAKARWTWHCERCGDAGCERHTLLPSA
jgi:nicotinamide riboside kinase